MWEIFGFQTHKYPQFWYFNRLVNCKCKPRSKYRNCNWLNNVWMWNYMYVCVLKYMIYILESLLKGCSCQVYGLCLYIFTPDTINAVYLTEVTNYFANTIRCKMNTWIWEWNTWTLKILIVMSFCEMRTVTCDELGKSWGRSEWIQCVTDFAKDNCQLNDL